ncbi:MAG: L-threonine 3-dehydrogenase [Verrucomicrobiota bacterium]
MKALVKREAGRGLCLEDVPVPTIGMGEVLVRVLKTGICGTDLHIYRWDDWAAKTVSVPLVIGHEFVGEIVEVGSEATDFSVGDLVSGEGHVVCGRCRNCLAGRRHLCAHTEGVGVQRPGAFAEYVAMPVSNLWNQRDAGPGGGFAAAEVGDEGRRSMSLDVMSIFDPFGNAVHSALAFDVLGEDILVTGAGPIGCMAAAVVRYAGARHVVVTDVNAYRLDLASRLGATRVVDVTRERLRDVQKELGMEEGFDVGLEMSGHPAAFKSMLGNLCHGGKMALLGIPEAPMEVDWNAVIFNGLTLKGIYGREMYETWYKMTMMLQGGLGIEDVITHRFGFADFEEGFRVMEEGKCGKVVLDWAA